MSMNLLLILPGFILAILVVLFYEYKITKMRKEPRNNVKFYVVCEGEGRYHQNLELWLRRPIWDEYHKFWKSNNCTARQLGFEFNFRSYGLNKNDFADMKEGEIREVFLNLED